MGVGSCSHGGFDLPSASWTPRRAGGFIHSKAEGMRTRKPLGSAPLSKDPRTCLWAGDEGHPNSRGQASRNPTFSHLFILEGPSEPWCW